MNPLSSLPTSNRVLRGSGALVVLLLSLPVRAGLPGTPVRQYELDMPNLGYAEVLVVQLTDDDGDGTIDGDDHADLVFIRRSLLVAVDGITGAELFSKRLLLWASASAQIAAADLDGDTVVEIVASDLLGLEVHEHDGSLAWYRDWRGADIPHDAALSIADLNQDGVPEILHGATALSVDRSVSWFDPDVLPLSVLLSSHAADLIPESPGLELLSGRRCYHADGSVAWTAPSGEQGFTAIGDLDADGDPEIALTSGGSGGELTLLDHLGNRLGSTLAPTLGQARPVTLVDVDADGRSEVLLAEATRLVLFDWDGATLTPRWEQVTQDESCCSGSVAHDLDGDGLPELLYQDEIAFYILEGRTGVVLFQDTLTSWTGYEIPQVVDLDDDPHAEILVLTRTGLDEVRLRVYEVPCSTTPRGIWNQHDYHVTNVDPEGRVPIIEPAPWRDGRQWSVQASEEDDCGVLSGLEGLADVFACPGEEIVLDATAARLSDCAEAELVFEWRRGDEVIGTDPVLRIDPEQEGLLEIDLSVGCLGESCCRPLPLRAGVLTPFAADATVADLSPCTTGLGLSWSHEDLHGARPVLFNLYRSVGAGASCADALSRAPIATGLDVTSWTDGGTSAGETHVYVLEVESFGTACAGPLGPGGGVITRHCLGTIVDETIISAAWPDERTCPGETVTLDASVLFRECADRVVDWSDGAGWSSDELIVTVSPAVTTTYTATVTCPGDPDCTLTRTVQVEVVPGFDFEVFPGPDREDCLPGIPLRWLAADFSDPVLGGVYHVYRSDAQPPSCEDALSRPPLAEALTGREWFDPAPLPDREHVYVIVAEDALPEAGSGCPTGPSFGGLTHAVCLPPIVDAFIPPTEPVWSTLRARNDGEEVTFLWPMARDLLPREQFVLLKAVDLPTNPFFATPLTSFGARSYTETDTSSPRQFFDLRVSGCHGLSPDEYPPGP
ncbi:MAG: VCBS repeat-containing protein [Acidobacteriota bacterium]